MRLVPMIGLTTALVAPLSFSSRAQAQAALSATEAPSDGLRLRHGIAFSGGEEIGSGPSSGLTGELYGVDWRIGAQLNNLWAVHLNTHLSFGSAHFGGGSGTTGNFAEAVMVERMLLDRFFVAAGGGYGVLNNPSGPLLQFRVGGYPLMFADASEARRRGLMLGVDVRAYFAGEAIGTVTQVSFGIGYEKF